MKLRRLCFYRRVSVHGGGVWSGPGGGCLLLVGAPAPGGVCSGGVCSALRQHPGETATAADGTHPTGMHSCFKMRSHLHVPSTSLFCERHL